MSDLKTAADSMICHSPFSWARVIAGAVALVLLGTVTNGMANTEQDLKARFSGVIQPFLEEYCLRCHDSDKPKGDLDLSRFESLESVVGDDAHWSGVLERLVEGDMPPSKAKKKPSAELRESTIAWIRSVLDREARRNAGDPGPVLARRLNNAEYDYSIRDLTGVDIRPTRSFPVDPANQAGFDNSGESLTMSPALLKKYLMAAREVAEHLVLKPDGFEFASHPVVADTDRDKWAVFRIIDFYGRQRTDYADFFEAAWRYEHRGELGIPGASTASTASTASIASIESIQSIPSIAEVAAASKLSGSYLSLIWSTLTGAPEPLGPIARLQAMWRALPASDDAKTVRAGCEAMRDYVVRLRAQIVPVVPNLKAPPIQSGSQTLVLWKDRQMAANRRKFDPAALRFLEPGAAAGDLKAAKNPELNIAAAPAERPGYEAAFAKFADLFPDAFFITERARVYLDPGQEQANAGRLLSAGLHSMTGYFRDDAPLYDLMLDEAGRRELDRLWQEFDFAASIPQRMHTSFVWFERTDSSYMRDPEFDPYRPEDKSVTAQKKIRELGALYLAKAKSHEASATVQGAIVEHFEIVAANIARVERERLAAEPGHLKALEDFTQKAFRRPLSPEEREDLRDFYRSSRTDNGLDHEEAIRDCIARVLMSPHFCFRIDLLEAAGDNVAEKATLPKSATHPSRALSQDSLASRLSYFLWASLPDAELLAHAAAGDLHEPEVLRAQARRMLKDERVRNFATEFAGNWLDFRRFEQHNGVDRQRFPAFNDELRRAMFEEPIRFLMDVVRTNRPVLDCLYAKDTFVNGPLARHYGISAAPPGRDAWVHVENAKDFGRGGLLPMAVFLTANSPGLRTSPVKRGNWVVKRILGERIPPPPPTVPELPADEAQMGDLTLRETLAKHRENEACAGCHARFDSFGLVFESYGPVGERRALDLGGRPVDTRAEFPKGREGAGLEGLQSYIRENRQTDFVQNLCRKLLAYGLGRTLILSDEPLISSMQAKLAADGYRFDGLIESIVTSPQFTRKRSAGN